MISPRLLDNCVIVLSMTLISQPMKIAGRVHFAICRDCSLLPEGVLSGRILRFSDYFFVQALWNESTERERRKIVLKSKPWREESSWEVLRVYVRMSQRIYDARRDFV